VLGPAGPAQHAANGRPPAHTVARTALRAPPSHRAVSAAGLARCAARPVPGRRSTAVRARRARCPRPAPHPHRGRCAPPPNPHPPPPHAPKKPRG
jgi:hypothetical protein